MNNTAESKQNSQLLGEKLEKFIAPLLSRMDAKIDKRLVRTFLLTLEVILTLRHNRRGLLLSDLGGCIRTPEQAPAGTKRLSNRLRCPKWVFGICYAG